jgi:tetratricopeptide (TPR) repeat protein
MAERSLPVLRRAIELAKDFGFRRTGGYAGLNLALAHFRLGDLAAAKEILIDLLPEFEALKDSFAQASACSYLALALEAAGEPGSAAGRYTQGLKILRSIGAPGYANDALAGLARCALAEQRLEDARHAAGQLWESLLQHGSTGMEFPIRAYLTCAQVFRAVGDPGAARAALAAGVQELNARAGKISDPAWRQSFLENIPEHKEIADRRNE